MPWTTLSKINATNNIAIPASMGIADKSAVPYNFTAAVAIPSLAARNAWALANNPDVMLLDEPFGSLDSWSKFDIAVDIIEVLKSSKTPTIMVSHDPQEAMKLADRIIVMLVG